MLARASSADLILSPSRDCLVLSGSLRGPVSAAVVGLADASKSCVLGQLHALQVAIAATRRELHAAWVRSGALRG